MRDLDLKDFLLRNQFKTVYSYWISHDDCSFSTIFGRSCGVVLGSVNTGKPQKSSQFPHSTWCALGKASFWEAEAPYKKTTGSQISKRDIQYIVDVYIYIYNSMSYSKNAMFICSTWTNCFISCLRCTVYSLSQHDQEDVCSKEYSWVWNLLNWTPSSKSARSLTPCGLSMILPKFTKWNDGCSSSSWSSWSKKVWGRKWSATFRGKQFLLNHEVSWWDICWNPRFQSLPGE